MKANIGVLLVNLGTPDAPTKPAVRKYLRQFLNDPRVIDIPTIARTILVNGIIIPFRVKNSTNIYKEVWTDKGSPLLLYNQSLKDKVQAQLGDDYHVDLAMRYQSPSMESVLEEFRKHNFKKIIVVPLFPQYASSSSGSAIQRVMEIISKWWVIPEVAIAGQFYDNEGYINTIAEQAKGFDLNSYDHILFSYHGLPERQVDKVYEGADDLCADHKCEDAVDRSNQHCYKATCYETTRLITEKLNIQADKYTVCFQSRLDKKWLEPFSDKLVEEQAKKGAKRLLFFSPAFTADCLETIVEIGSEYQEIFEEHGGEKVDLVPSLNDHPMWVDTVAKLVQQKV